MLNTFSKYPYLRRELFQSSYYYLDPKIELNERTCLWRALSRAVCAFGYLVPKQFILITVDLKTKERFPALVTMEMRPVFNEQEWNCPVGS